MIEKDGMVLNKLEESIKDNRCYTKHIDESVMIIRILCILPFRVQVSCSWNRMSAVEIAGFLDCDDGIDIKTKLMAGFKVMKRCKQCAVDHQQ